MRPMVIAKPGPLKAAFSAGKHTCRKLERATDRKVSRSTINSLLNIHGYGVSREKAVALAQAIGRPVGELFVHHDGAPLGGDDE